MSRTLINILLFHDKLIVNACVSYFTFAYNNKNMTKDVWNISSYMKKDNITQNMEWERERHTTTDINNNNNNLICTTMYKSLLNLIIFINYEVLLLCYSLDGVSFGHNLGSFEQWYLYCDNYMNFLPCFAQFNVQINQNVCIFIYSVFFCCSFSDWNTSEKVIWEDIMCDKSLEDTFMTW